MCAQVRAAAALSNIRQVDEEELEVIVGSAIEKPTVIDFFATWCGPCLLLAQELEKVCVSTSRVLAGQPQQWAFCCKAAHSMLQC